jgi:hypothetical protein
MPGVRSCLVRYGVMSHVGRFSASHVREILLERGQVVVVQTDRGIELGEILIVVDGPSDEATDRPTDRPLTSPEHELTQANSSCVLRVASPDDLTRSLDAKETRIHRLALCEQILRDSDWPWPLVDVEPLLDARLTVLHYLGPHHIDVAPLRARFRVECDFDVIFEPVGDDTAEERDSPGEQLENPGVGGCGTCDCSRDGGCGRPAPTPNGPKEQHKHAASGCSSESHSGCASCGISRMKAEWSQRGLDTGHDDDGR